MGIVLMQEAPSFVNAQKIGALARVSGKAIYTHTRVPRQNGDPHPLASAKLLGLSRDTSRTLGTAQPPATSREKGK